MFNDITKKHYLNLSGNSILLHDFSLLLSQFDDKIVDFSAPPSESATIEDLMGVVTIETTCPSPSPQYTFKLNYGRVEPSEERAGTSSAASTNQDEPEENHMEPNVSNPVSKYLKFQME